MNKVYLLELVEENNKIHKEKEQADRPGRQAVVITDLKQKFVSK